MELDKEKRKAPDLEEVDLSVQCFDLSVHPFDLSENTLDLSENPGDLNETFFTVCLLPIDDRYFAPGNRSMHAVLHHLELHTFKILVTIKTEQMFSYF
ncbi:hypothetical protein [Peribacillus tepidiphilus]|uniref:hypothetical protein n=1 Tax=Peribacillus tepidiphilus TaxID=2652445 RepID=UPI001291A173|nr:hypothetical protein [Peribacillus tepidiphilus]